MNRSICQYLALSLLVGSNLSAADFYVSPKGNDSNPGTKAKPFASIQKAADTVKPGDTCHIQAGRYRETVTLKTSGTKGKPIRFIAEGEVVIDGSNPVNGPWKKHEGRIWRTSVEGPQIQQLFAKDQMQNEARWPDATFEKRWDRKSWGKVGKKSEYGRIEAPGLGKTKVDVTGAIAMLNVAHQFFSWTRTVTSHEKGSDVFTYDKDLPGLAFADPKKGLLAQGAKPTPWLLNQWKDDYFYLFGKLGFLNAPGEWFHDPKEKLLYYMPKGDGAPEHVSVKARDFGIKAKDVNYVDLQGIRFFGCAFQFSNCSHVNLSDCHVTYVAFRRRILISEQEKYQGRGPTAVLAGSNNSMKTCSIRYASGSALAVSGDNNTIENSIITDGGWSGTLWHSLVKLNGKGNQMRRCTISQCGAPLVQHHGPNVIEYCHFFNSGMTSEDIAAVYTAGGKDGNACRGAIIRYNWVHGVNTDHGCGIGIRGDDMTRGLIVHNNVVWDCGMAGIIIKGGENQVFNNTVFDVTSGVTKKWMNKAGLIIPTQPEPRKPWKPYHEMGIYLDVQNSNSIIANNLVDDIHWRKKKIEAPGIQANHEMKGDWRKYLTAPDKWDFGVKPEALKMLDKPFRIKTGEGAKMKTPYMGAYEPGKPAWKPGADRSIED